MRDFLERYKIILETIGPVFIGSGKSLRKNEYAIDKQSKKAWFFDEIKLYEYFSERKMLDKYEKSSYIFYIIIFKRQKKRRNRRIL